MSSNPQGASPANTYTQSDLEDLSDGLKRALPSIQIGLRGSKVDDVCHGTKIDICDLQWDSLGLHDHQLKNDLTDKKESDSGCCEGPQGGEQTDPLDWHGAPRFSGPVDIPRSFRNEVRAGRFTGPTNGVCPGFLQCNMVVLPEGRTAFDFLLFCQRNPQSCPLIEVLDVGSVTPTAVAPGADLRTDVPK